MSNFDTAVIGEHFTRRRFSEYVFDLRTFYLSREYIGLTAAVAAVAIHFTPKRLYTTGKGFEPLASRNIVARAPYYVESGGKWS